MSSPCLNFLLNETLNHLVPQIIDGLHVGGFQGQLAHFGPLKEGLNMPVYLYRVLGWCSDAWVS